ncbi:MAG: hypothetical protein FWG79_02000 [Bacteroidales bacterium]|nr:hypothetical protein [Bacteroidales bacterium]
MKKFILPLIFGSLFTFQNVLQSQGLAHTTNLPAGIQRTGRLTYELSVIKLELHPTGSKMDLLLDVKTPQESGDTNHLRFIASGVNWSEQGGFADENVRMSLMEDYRIPLGKSMDIVLKKAAANSGTFAEIDCNGLKFLSLDATLVFDESLVIPADCKQSPCDKLSVDFSMTIEAWSDLIVGLNLPAFQIPSLEGWVFQANQVVFDFSENRKSPMAELPEIYIQTYFPGDENLWRGVFIKYLEVTLPESFEGDERFSFQAQSLIIDEMGITGILSAKNVIPKGLAHIGGWGLSVDTLGLEFLTNRLKSGGFAGELQLPITDTSLTYFGHIFENNRYLMQVDLHSSIQFDFLKTSSVEIKNESFVKMELVEKRFLAQAVLHGEMKFEEKNIGGVLSISSIGFENLIFQNQKPYLSVGKITHDGSIDLSGFPAIIDKLDFVSENENLLLNSAVSIGLTSATDGGFRGTTGFTIRSKLEKTERQHRWIYDGFSIDEISVAVDEHTFSLSGKLAVFENDPIYGQGFSGQAELNIKQPEIVVKTSATFGKTEDFRYWFADGLVSFGKTGIPIFAGLALNGFGGGAYQRMKPIFDKKSSSSVGFSNSGIQYVPDASTKFGIQAAVTVAAQSNPKVFNGQAGLEMSFNTSGGLNFIKFNGAAKIAQGLSNDFFETMTKNIELLGVMDPSTQEQMRKESAKDAAITARLALEYDFNNNVFRGLFNTEISAPFLKGSGQAELYLSSNKWYFHVGHPERRFGISLGVGSLSLNTGVYLMVGHDIPAMPKPPATIMNLLKNNEFSSLEQSRGKDISSINTGRGFAFGTDFSMNTGDLTFLIFFAQFQTQLGFDFMLKDYGNWSCANNTSTIGIDGWYGSGQAYAYLAGKLGLGVKVFGKTRKFTILDAKVGTLLEAQLPNPVWFSGQLAAQYNVLNGLIKGNCNFKFEIGEKCELPNLTEIEEMKIIAEMKPSQDDVDVSVFCLPQAAFNLPVKEIHASETETFKVELESFTLTSENTLFAGDLEWNSDRTSVVLKPLEILPSQASTTISATLRFFEKSNGVWKPLLNGENQPQKETLSQTFTTGDRPKTLPLSEILYTYPVIDQQNFYVQESSEGYIQLKRNFEYLFDVDNYDYVVNFEASDGVVFSSDVVYNIPKIRVEWEMPNLNAQTNYTVRIIGNPRETSENFTNVSENYTSQDFGDDDNSAEIRNTEISETAVNPQTVEIFSYEFRTSSYPTFAAAVNSITLQKATLQNLLVALNSEQYLSTGEPIYLSANCNQPTNFDDIELFGSTYTQEIPLVNVRANLNSENIYFSNHINPLIYQSYNYNGLVTLPRTTEQSLLPTWAMTPLKLSANSQMFPWTYDLPAVYRRDLQQVQVQLADQHAQGKYVANYDSIISQTLPIPGFGAYQFSLQYRLPCGKSGTFANLSFDYTN